MSLRCEFNNATSEHSIDVDELCLLGISRTIQLTFNTADGEPMDEDFDGEAMADVEVSNPNSTDPPPSAASANKEDTEEPKVEPRAEPPQQRRRPRAVDMFADSDEDN